MKNLNPIEKILKFFSLIKYNKKDYALYFVQAVIRGAQPLIHVIFIEKIVFAITKQDIFLFEKTLYLYICIIFTYELLWFITRRV